MTPILAVALALYALGALVYIRMAVFRAIPLCRAVFVLRLLTMTALMMIATDHEPGAAWLALAYVLETLWSWRRQSIEELRAGTAPHGAAKLVARRLAP